MVIILKRKESIKFSFTALYLGWHGTRRVGRRPGRGRLFLRLRNSEVEFQGQASKPGRVEDQHRRRSNVQVFAKLLSFVGCGGCGPGPGAVRVLRGWAPPPDNHWGPGSVAKWKLGQGSAESSDAASAAACFPLCQRGCIKTAIISSVSNNTNEHSYKNWLHKVSRQPAGDIFQAPSSLLAW